MKKKILVVLIIGIILFVSSCTVSPTPTGSVTVDSSKSDIQVVKLGLDKNGYTPNPITVKVNEPVLLVKDKSLKGCSVFVIQKELGIDANLMNKDEYEFTPAKKGTFKFTCSMGMYEGTIQVI